MSIKFVCSTCQTPLRVPDTAAGRNGRCPRCSARVTVPNPEPSAPAPPSPFDFPLTAPPQPEPIIRFDDIIVPEPETSGIEIDLFASAASADDPSSRPGLGELPVDLSTPPPEPQPKQNPHPRRHRLKLWGGIAIALIVLAALAGGLYWQIGPSTLTGELIAECLPDGQLSNKFVSPHSVDLSAEEIAQILDNLRRSPRSMVSSRAVVKLSADNDRLEVSITPGSQTAIYRVDITSDRAIARYLRQHRAEMEQVRAAELSHAVNQLFRTLKTSASHRAAEHDLGPFRDSVGFTGSVHGAGYFLAAQHREQLWPCVSEDGEAVYFLLPRGITHFELRGLPRPGAKISFPGVFEVRVQP